MTTTTIILPSPLGLAQISRFPFCKNSWEGKSTQWRLGLLSISFGSWPFSYFYLRCTTVQECWRIIYLVRGVHLLYRIPNFREINKFSGKFMTFFSFLVRFKNVCHFWILFKRDPKFSWNQKISGKVRNPSFQLYFFISSSGSKIKFKILYVFLFKNRENVGTYIQWYSDSLPDVKKIVKTILLLFVFELFSVKLHVQYGEKII